MNSVVLDASAMLAAIQDEPGGRSVIELLPFAFASTVNLAEVQSKLMLRGIARKSAWDLAMSLSVQAVSFDLEQSEVAGSLVAETRSLGLSLGDRACLALALTMKAPAYTTDRAWSALNVGVPVHLLR